MSALDALVDQLANAIAERVVDRLVELELVGGEPEPEPLLDRNGVAKLLDVSTATVDRLRREGLPWIRVGDAARFERETVLTWLRERSAPKVSGT